MKKISLLLLSMVLLIGITGCKKISKLTQVRIPYSTQITVPGNLPILQTPMPIATPAIPTNTESTLKNMGYNLDMVERIEIEKFDLELNTPEDGDLNFFNTIQVYIKADGLEEVLLAEKAVPESETKLTKVTLDCENTDLLEYFKKPEFTLRAMVSTDRIVTQEHIIDVKSVFMVDVKFLGL